MTSNPKLIEIAVDQLRADLGIQLRIRLDEQTVEEYAQAMRDCERFPPIIAYEEKAGEPLVIMDGFHRLAAARLAEVKMLKVEVRSGDRKVALKAALAANATHGLRRTNEDKRRALQCAMSEYPDLSAQSYANMCGVSPDLASRVLREQVSEKDMSKPKKRLGRDGKSYPATQPRKAQVSAHDPGKGAGEIRPVSQQPRQTTPQVAPLPISQAAVKNFGDIFPTQLLEELPELRNTLPNWENYFRERVTANPDLKRLFRVCTVKFSVWLEGLHAVAPTTISENVSEPPTGTTT